MSTSGAPVLEEDLRDRAVVGAFWAMAQKWLVRLGTLVAFVVLGRLLSPAEFGVVALAMVFINVLSVATDAGFSMWLVQKRDLTAAAVSTAFWISVLLGALLTGLLLLASGALADLLDSDELRLLLPVLAGTMFVAGLSSVPVALMQRGLDFRSLAIRQVTATASSVVVAIALALAGAGVWALVAQHLVRVVVAALMLWRASDFRPRFTFVRADAREMTSFGVKALGVHTGAAVRDQASALLVGALLGTVSLGLWTVANRLVNVVVDLCSAAVGSVAAPVFAQLQDQQERRTAAFGRVLGASTLVLAPTLVAMSLVSPELVPFVFGEQWRPSADVASVLTVAVLFTALTAPHRAVLMGTGRAGTELALTVLGIVGQVLAIVALAGRGLLAVAAGLAVWAVAQYPVRAVVLRAGMGIPLRAHGQLMAVLLAAGVSAGVVLGLDVWLRPEGLARFAVVVAAGAFVYVPAVYLLARPTVRDVVGSGMRVVRRRRGSPAAPLVPPDLAPAPRPVRAEHP